MRLFAKREPAAPDPVPTDLILPLHYWDDLEYARSLSLDCTFRFDDVLDEEKVRAALSRLLEIGEWGKVGARIRKNQASGKLEYHVPVAYDERRPGFIYTSTKHDTNIDDHPLASQLPKAVNTPALLENPKKFRLLVRSPGAPSILEELLYSDLPQLSVHTITFNDATLLTITFMHTLMDVMGISSLFQGWTAVLRGQEDEVPKFAGFNRDPFTVLGEVAPSERYLFADKSLKGVGFFVFAFRMLFDLAWYRKEAQRIVFLPGKYLQQMRNNALGELASQSIVDKEPFVSEGDVLLAWWSRVMIRALESPPTRAVTIMNVFDSRPLLAELGHIPSTDAAIFSNAAFPTYTFLSTSQILTEPLSFIASRIRQSLDQQRTKEQLHALTTIQRTTIDSTGHPAVFGDSGQQIIACSNWGKARLFQIDFSAAVRRQGIPLSQRANQLGRPSYINSTGHSNGFSIRNGGPVLGKDAAGNFWLACTLRSGAWAKVEQQLQLMSEKGDADC